MLKKTALCDGHFVLFRFSKNSLSHISTARTEDASVLAFSQHVCQLANFVNLQMKCVVPSKQNQYFIKAFLNNACDSMK